MSGAHFGKDSNAPSITSPQLAEKWHTSVLFYQLLVEIGEKLSMAGARFCGGLFLREEVRMLLRGDRVGLNPRIILEGSPPWRFIRNAIHHMNIIRIEVIDLVALYRLSFQRLELSNSLVFDDRENLGFL